MFKMENTTENDKKYINSSQTGVCEYECDKISAASKRD